MTGHARPPTSIHTRTPLVGSPGLSRRSGCRVLLKLDALQPSGSFKSRGVGTRAASLVREKGPDAHVICASGGNAGLACAYAAQALGVKCSIYVPTTTTADMMARIGSLGAHVIQGGTAWHEADAAARQAAAEDPLAAYLHPFDHSDVVAGNATIALEIAEQLGERGVVGPPDAVICSVGGGGLLAGVLKGLESLPWPDTSVLAMETYGASSLYASMHASYASDPPAAKLATIDRIDTIATSLGATCVSKHVLDAVMARDAQPGPGKLCSVRVEDAATVAAMSTFLDEHCLLVEPSCSACFLPLLSPCLLKAALPPSVAARIGHPDGSRRPTIVVEVCGGNGAPLWRLLEWQQRFRHPGSTDFGKPASVEPYRWSVFGPARGVEQEGEEALL